MYLGSLLCLIWSWQAVSAAILSIDYGTEWTKAALVKPGIPLEIVLTKDTKRKEQSVIAFKGNERLYGGDAANLASRFPQHTYPALKTLLGRSVDSHEAKEYTESYPASKLVSTEQGSIAFEHGTDIFTVEELVAMEFINMRKNAELMADGGVRDTIFTVPPHFDHNQRAALLSAAQLAGLRPIELINDGLAVALDYAKSRTFNTSQVHAIFDMGAGSTSATIVKFESKSVKDVGRFNKTITSLQVLGTSSTVQVSGNVMSERLYKYLFDTFADICSKKGSASFSTSYRAHARLLKEATRVKQILSANNEASVSLESLHDDIDFRHKIPRTLFEELTADLGAITTDVVKNALKQASVPIADVQSVILHGGAARVPFVQSALLNVATEQQIARNVNADEAAVMGAVFRGAGLSGSFRVKELNIQDLSSTGFAYTIAGISTPLFDAGVPIGAQKNLTFTDQTADFELTLTASGEPAFDIAQYQIKGVREATTDLTKAHGCKSPAIAITTTLDHSGQLSISSANALCEVEDRPGVADKLKSWFGSSEKDEKQANGTESAETAIKTSTKVVPLSFSTIKVGYTPTAAEKEKSLQKIATFEKIDADRVARETARNGLEAYIYKLRDYLDGSSFNQFSTSQEREDLQKLSAAATEWMYDQGETATLDELVGKKQSMKTISDRVLFRQQESRGRTPKVDAMQKQISTGRAFVKSQLSQISEHNTKKAELKKRAEENPKVEVGDETLTDDASKENTTAPVVEEDFELPEPLYTESELNVLAGKLDHAEEWLQERSAEQDKLAVTADPVLLISELERRTAKITEDFMYLLRKVTYADQSKSKSKPKSKTKSKPKSSPTKDAKSKADKSAADKAAETPVDESVIKPDTKVEADLPAEGEAPLPDTSKKSTEEPAAPQPEAAADPDAATHDEL